MSNVNFFVVPGGNSSTRASRILRLLTTISLDCVTGFDKSLCRRFDTLTRTRYDAVALVFLKVELKFTKGI